MKNIKKTDRHKGCVRPSYDIKDANYLSSLLKIWPNSRIFNNMMFISWMNLKNIFGK